MAEEAGESEPERPEQPERPGRRGRHAVPLRLDPAVYDALARWASDELRSVNAQIELVIRRALAEAGRAATDAKPLPRRGRPPADPS